MYAMFHHTDQVSGAWSNTAGRTRRSGVAAMDSRERTAGVDGADGAMAGFRVGEGPDSHMQGVRGHQSQGV